jgi:hypothetical protein
MKRIRIASALLALAVMAALAIVTTTSKHSVRAVYASTGCTNATLTGNYAFTNQGFASPSRSPATNGNQVPFAAVGLSVFDGGGNTSTSFTLVFDGAVSTGQTGAGTYTVNPDCTGSISFTTGSLAGLNMDMVIIGGGTEVFAIDKGFTATATLDLKKQ